jgi:D-threo-aldose 1-dehydrogenase
MTAITRRTLGRTGVQLTQLGMGGAPLGDLFERVPEAQAQATIQAAWEAGVRYFDTAPFYGYGQSEHRFGHFLRQQERRQFAISTKVGRVFKATRDLDAFDRGFWAGGLPFEFYFDYGYEGIMRSWEDSLQRLGLNSVDLLLIHDLDSFFHDSEQRFSAHLNRLITSGWRALEELRSAGLVKGLGAGINRMGAVPRLLDAVDLDFFIIAMPYTLLDQKALDGEFPLCQERGVHIVIGSVFASGILATGPVEGAKYAYAPAPPDILEKTRRMEAVCRRHRVPLAAAALQFPLAHPLVSAVIPGALAPGHIHRNVELFHHPIPEDLWSELKAEGLLRQDAPTP